MIDRNDYSVHRRVRRGGLVISITRRRDRVLWYEATKIVEEQ